LLSSDECFKFGFFGNSGDFGNLLAHSRDLSDDDLLRKNASFLRTHSRSSEAAVTCDPNGRPLTTGLQAVSGFPTNQAFLAQLLIRRRRSRQIQLQYRIEEKLLSIDKICTCV
jgi:hypothetical protein